VRPVLVPCYDLAARAPFFSRIRTRVPACAHHVTPRNRPRNYLSNKEKKQSKKLQVQFSSVHHVIQAQFCVGSELFFLTTKEKLKPETKE